MKSEYEQLYHQLEKDHFWFKARRSYLLQELRSIDKNATILDIGCSSGILLQELYQIGFKISNLFGIDISEQAIERCKILGLKNTFVMDAQNFNFNQKFDIIIASDCLEHLKDDEKALQNWHTMLQVGGTAYIFVPAFMQLWSQHDLANMHYRRYTKSGLKNKLIKNGFEVKKSGFWNFFLFAPIFLIRLVNRTNSSKNEKTGNLNKLPSLNSLLLNLLYFENKLLLYINFPFGISTYCIATKIEN